MIHTVGSKDNLNAPKVDRSIFRQWSSSKGMGVIFSCLVCFQIVRAGGLVFGLAWTFAILSDPCNPVGGLYRGRSEKLSVFAFLEGKFVLCWRKIIKYSWEANGTNGNVFTVLLGYRALPFFFLPFSSHLLQLLPFFKNQLIIHLLVWITYQLTTAMEACADRRLPELHRDGSGKIVAYTYGITDDWNGFFRQRNS